VSKSRKRVGWILGSIVTALLAVLVPFLLVTPTVSGETPTDRIAKARDLAERAPPGAADALALAAMADADPGVRTTALLCLNRFARPEDRRVVEVALADADAGVRRAACKTAVFCHDDGKTVARLAEICRSDPDLEVARAAAIALTASEEASALVALVNLMETGPDEARQTLAAEALVRKFRIPVAVDRGDSRLWRRLVAAIKYTGEVRDAFRQSGVRLEQDVAILQEAFEEHASSCHSPDQPRPGAGGPATVIQVDEP